MLTGFLARRWCKSPKLLHMISLKAWLRLGSRTAVLAWLYPFPHYPLCTTEGIKLLWKIKCRPCSPKLGLPISFFLSPSGWIFPLRRGSSSSLLILPGLLRSDWGGLSVSSPSGEREDACGLCRWCKFLALEFYSASFLHWISSLSYPFLSHFSPLNFLTELSSFYYSLYLWWIFK